MRSNDPIANNFRHNGLLEALGEAQYAVTMAYMHLIVHVRTPPTQADRCEWCIKPAGNTKFARARSLERAVTGQ